LIYHVLNRGRGRRELFSSEADFRAFVSVLEEALGKFDVELLAWCLMENHWHLMLRPGKAEALSRMVAWVAVTHARRHHIRHPKPGSGHLYQGRFKSFPVEDDEHFLAVARYIHAEPLRAKRVKRAQDWRWSDVAARGTKGGGKGALPLSAWPVRRPADWVTRVNAPMEEAEAAAVETSVRRGTPYGSKQWATRIAAKLGLGHTLRPWGRPRKPVKALSPRYRKRRERMMKLEIRNQKSE